MKPWRSLSLLFVALCGLLTALLVSPTVTASTERKGVQAAWVHARKAGSYRFAADIVQTTTPLPTVTNVGRWSREDTLHIEGWTDLPERALDFTMWSQGGNVLNAADGLEVHVEEDRAFIRRGSQPWEEANNFSSLFAPEGDFLAFLVATKDVAELGAETRVLPSAEGTVTFTRYAFRVDGPGFAAYMREQLERHYAEKGELPPGIELDLPRAYVDMTGEGELWVGEDGLPMRQILHLRLPDTEDDRVEAQVNVTFSDFGGAAQPRPHSPLVSRRLLQQIGLFVSTLALIALIIAYRRSRKLYAALALALIASLVFTPLLQSVQAATFVERQAARAREQEAQAQESKMTRTLQNLREAQSQTSPTLSGPAALALIDGDDGRDTDRDGLTDVQEAFLGSDPRWPNTGTVRESVLADPPQSDDGSDTDHDGLTDYKEGLLGTDPGYWDTDGDGITDTLEIEGFTFGGRTWYTDPLERDSNGDGIGDGSEWIWNAEGQPQDADGDDIPDLFDRDNDDDQVPDNLDISPYQNTRDTRTFSNENPFGLIVDGLAPNVPTYVELQLRPVVTDHLWYAYNVLDWPKGDRQGQVQDDDGATFYEIDPDIDKVPNENGDLKLLPMLEVRISGSPTNLPLTDPRFTMPLDERDSPGITGTATLSGTGSNTTFKIRLHGPGTHSVEVRDGSCDDPGSERQALGSTSGTLITDLSHHLKEFADGGHAIYVTNGGTVACGDIPKHFFDGDRMIDRAELEPYGIALQNLQDDGDEMSLYVPLQLTLDSKGGARVAFYAKLFYRPAASWGSEQQVRVVWAVQALVDECASYSLGDFNNDGVEDFSSTCQAYASHNQVHIVHVYHDAWYLTGLKVREDRGTKVAFAYEDPDEDTIDGLNDDSSLLMLSDRLDLTFLGGRDCEPALENGTCQPDNQRDITVDTIYERFNHSTNTGITPEERWNIPDVLTVITRTYEHVDRFIMTVPVTETKAVLDGVFTDHWSSTDPITPSVLFAREEVFRAANLDVQDEGDALSWDDKNILTVRMPSHDDEGGSKTTVAGISVAPYRYTESTGWEPCPIEAYWLELARRYPFYDESDPAVRDGKILGVQLYYLTLYKGIERIVQVGDYPLVAPFTQPDKPLAAAALDYAGKGAKFIINKIFIVALAGINPRSMGSFWKYLGRLAGEAGLKTIYGLGSKLLRLPTTLAREFHWLRWLSSRFGRGLTIGLALTAVLALAILIPQMIHSYLNDELWAKITLHAVVAAIAGYLLVIKPIITVIQWIRALHAAEYGLLTSIKMALFARGEVVEVSWKAGLVGAIISIAVIWIVFGVYAAKMRAGSPEFNQLLAYTLGATIIAIVMFVISLTVVGAIIAAIFMVADVFAMAFGFSISGWLAEQIGKAIYGFVVTIDVGSDMEQVESGLMYPEQGMQAGNAVDFYANITTTITHTNPSDGRVIPYLSKFYSKENLRSTTITYTLTTAKEVITPTRNQMNDLWDVSLHHEYGFFKKDMFQGQVVARPGMRFPLTAGRNRQVPLYLNTGYAIPCVECWTIVAAPYCEDETVSGSMSNSLSDSIVLDVFPPTLDEFCELTWGNLRVPDVDGDGLRAQKYNGNDPDDTDWDYDDDGLADGYELEMRAAPFEEGGARISPYNPDTDMDGLCDADEIRLGTDPGHIDTDRDGLLDSQEVFHQDCNTGVWTGGWSATYTYTDDFGVLQTLDVFITSDPLSPDEDDDGINDLAEKSLGMPYHPRVWNRNPLVITTEVGDEDRFVARNQTFAYTATVHSEVITPLFSLGVLSVTLPTELGGNVLTDTFNIFMGEHQPFRTDLTVQGTANTGPVIIDNIARAALHDRQEGDFSPIWAWFEPRDTVTASASSPPGYVALAPASDSEYTVASVEEGNGLKGGIFLNKFFDNGAVNLRKGAGSLGPPSQIGPVNRGSEVPAKKLTDYPPDVACNASDQCLTVWSDAYFEDCTWMSFDWIAAEASHDSPLGNNWIEPYIKFDGYTIWDGNLTVNCDVSLSEYPCLGDGAFWKRSIPPNCPSCPDWECGGGGTERACPDSISTYVSSSRYFCNTVAPEVWESDLNDEDKLYVWCHDPNTEFFGDPCSGNYVFSANKPRRTCPPYVWDSMSDGYWEYVKVRLCLTVEPNYGYEIRAAGDAIAGSVPVKTIGITMQNPVVASDGTDFLTVWERLTVTPVETWVERDDPWYPEGGYTTTTYANHWAVYSRKVAPDGTMLSSELRLDPADDMIDDRRPDVAWVGDRYLVVWEREKEEDGERDVYMAYVSQDGQSMEGPYVVANSAYPETWPSVAYDPETGQTLVVHTRVPADLCYFGGACFDDRNVVAARFVEGQDVRYASTVRWPSTIPGEFKSLRVTYVPLDPLYGDWISYHEPRGAWLVSWIENGRVRYRVLDEDGTPLSLEGGPIQPGGQNAYTLDAACLDSHSGHGDCAMVTASDTSAYTIYLERVFPTSVAPWKGWLTSDLVTDTVTVDNDAPTASFTGLTNGQYLSANGAYTLTIGGDAADATSGVAQVEIRIDGGSWEAIETSGAWAYAWGVGAYGDGSHTLRVRAVDAVGNRGSAQTITVYLDRTPPTPPTHLTSNEAGTILAATQDDEGRWHTALSGTVGDPAPDSGVASVEVLLTPNSNDWQTATLGTGTWALNYALSVAGEGNTVLVNPTGFYTLSVRATDGAGNRTSETDYLQAQFGVDTTPPVADLAYVGPSTTTITTTLVLTGTVTDPGSVAAGVQGLEIALTQIPQLPSDWQPANVSSPGSVTSNWSHPVPDLEGFYTIDLRGTDVLGNRNDDQSTWQQWQGEIDTLDPRAVITLTYRGAGKAAQTCYEGWAEDFNLTTDGFMSPCRLQAADRHYYEEPWYLDVVSDTTRLYQLTPSCIVNGFREVSPTLRACDVHGHCTVVTGTLPGHTPPLASTVLTPAHESVLTTADPVSLTVGAYAADYLRALTVTISDGWSITATWPSDTVTDTLWFTTWDPPAEGHYTLVTLVEDWAGRVQTETQPISISVDTHPPYIAIPTTVLTTAHWLAFGYVALTGVATDSVGLEAVEVSVDGGPWDEASFDGTSWHYPWHLGEEPDYKTYSVSARATDAADRIVAATEIITVDLVGPAAMTVTLAYTDSFSALTPLEPGQIIRDVLSPTLILTWTASSDGGGLSGYWAGWTEGASPSLDQLTSYGPGAGHHEQVVPEASVRYAHVVVRDVYGNQEWQTLGPVYVDTPTTPDIVADLGHHGWMESGCSQVGADREVTRNAYTGAALDDLQRLYATWDGSALRLTWTGANWDGDGDLFIYLDTAPGAGATQAYDPYSTGPAITFPTQGGSQFRADYLIWVEDETTAKLVTWSGGWDVAGATALDTDHYQLDTGLDPTHTDLLIPWTWLGSPTSLHLVALASEEDALRIWATMPDKNPLNSERVVDALASEYVDEDFTLTQRHQAAPLTSDVCPNLGQFADIDLRVDLAADPVGVEVGYLEHDLPSLLTPGAPLDADLDGVPDPVLPLPLDVTPALVGNGDTITYTLNYANIGTAVAAGARVTVTARGALNLSGGSPLILSLPLSRTGVLTFTAAVSASPGDQSAEVDAVVADALHGEFDWLWVQHDVDTAGPISLTIIAPAQYILPYTNTVRGSVYDLSGVPLVTLEVRPSGSPTATTLLCTDETPYDGQWACLWNVSGAAEGAQFQLRARATDRYGNPSAWTGWHDVTVDASPPHAIILSADTEAALADSLLIPDELMLAGEVQDNRQASEVEVCAASLDESEQQCTQVAAAPGTTPTGEWHARAPVLGTGDGFWQRFRFYGIDGAGNRSSALVTRTARVDVTEPEIVVDVAPGAVLGPPTMVLSATVSDGYGIDRVNGHMARPDGYTTVFTPTGSSWTYVHTFDTARRHTLGVRAWDLAGNLAQVGPFELQVYTGTMVADLSLDKAAASDPAITGRPFTYTLTVHNHGPAEAVGTVVTDVLPIATSLLSATPEQGSCGPAVGGVVTCTLDTVTNGNDVAIIIRVNVPLTTTGKLVNAAVVASEKIDFYEEDNQAVVHVSTFQPVSGLEAHSSGATPLGDVTTFSATIATGSDVIYSWSFGDGVTATGKMVSHTYAAVGRYIAIVQASNKVNALTATTYISVDIPIGRPVLEEGFEDEFTPAGWQNVVVKGTSSEIAWRPAAAIAHSGDRSAHHADIFGMYDSWLVTPQVTPTIGSELVFWQYAKYEHEYLKRSIWISTGSGDPKYDEFVQLVELGPGPESTWEEVRIDLSAYVGQPIYIAFRYEGDFADVWYIDDVQVTAPLAAINDSPTLLGQTTALTASAGIATNVTYAWSLGDGVTGSGAVVTHTYLGVGTYTAVVTAVNSVSEFTATTTVNVYARSSIYLPFVLSDYVSCHDEYEPDDVIDDAQPIATDGTPQHHNFHRSEDADWIYFEVADADVDYVIETLNLTGGADTVIYLFDSDGETLLDWNDDADGQTTVSRLDFNPCHAGIFYVAIVQYDPAVVGCDVAYTVRVTAQP